jgi:hypothetical protein
MTMRDIIDNMDKGGVDLSYILGLAGISVFFLLFVIYKSKKSENESKNESKNDNDKNKDQDQDIEHNNDEIDT